MYVDWVRNIQHRRMWVSACVCECVRGRGGGGVRAPARARVCMTRRTCLRVKCTLYEGIASGMSVNQLTVTNAARGIAMTCFWMNCTFGISWIAQPRMIHVCLLYLNWKDAPETDGPRRMSPRRMAPRRMAQTEVPETDGPETDGAETDGTDVWRRRMSPRC